ncbi:MAG: D-glycero-beta-D-manno-heptose-7-phosphate kinase [Flavobacteriales bacterium]|nr:D-glycero-beta-D-manno-heptose-7-phosphate kinase [Flavobacteriales bacterium]
MNAEEIEKLFKSFQDLQVMVIGDVMIDAYMWGKVNRISPEAPVPIVSVEKIENRLGGAANVALNIQALGATPLIYSVIGSDENAKTFCQLLADQNMSDAGIVKSDNRRTTIKTRVLSGGNQMLRVDEEIETDLNSEDEAKLIDVLTKALENGDIGAVIFEDYDKGVITKAVIDAVVSKAKERGIVVSVDPKKKNFNTYRGISLFKPNLKEIREGMKVDIYENNIEEVEGAVSNLMQAQDHKMVLVTLSEMGVYIRSEEGGETIPAHFRDITDVSGAGDTVIGVASLCLALNASPKFIASLSNLAGGIVCEKVGVVPIDRDQLLEEAKSLLVE